MKTLNELLSSPILQRFVEKTEQIKPLKIIWQYVIEYYGIASEIANYEGSKLTVTVGNGAWATRLRYHTPEILVKLRLHREFKQLRTIRVRILPDRITTCDKIFTRPALSEQTIKLIRETAANISNEPLKQALLHLAR
jgi:hypothetical protein